MSHFIGLVFVKSDENNLDLMLEPYDEQTENENYLEFVDCTEEVEDRFKSLPDKDERLDENGNPYRYLCDKEHYPTIESLAEDWFGYRKNADGIYGYTHNPNAKWDWYAIGNRWDGYIYGKDGKEYNELDFDDIDWDKMLETVEETYTDYNGVEKKYNCNHIPFCIVDTDGNWHERGQMGWFAFVSNEKDTDVWESEVREYIKHLTELPKEDRKAIVVHAVDFHI